MTYWETPLPRSYGPRCPKCGRFVSPRDVFPVLDVLTYEREGLDTVRDCIDCPRDGRVEVSWW